MTDRYGKYDKMKIRCFSFFWVWAEFIKPKIQALFRSDRQKVRIAKWYTNPRGVCFSSIFQKRALSRNSNSFAYQDQYVEEKIIVHPLLSCQGKDDVVVWNTAFSFSSSVEKILQEKNEAEDVPIFRLLWWKWCWRQFDAVNANESIRKGGCAIVNFVIQSKRKFVCGGDEVIWNESQDWDEEIFRKRKIRRSKMNQR